MKTGSKWLDLAAGKGEFKKFLLTKNIFSIEEADFAFGNKRQGFHQMDLSNDFDLKVKYEVVSIIEALHFFENPRKLLRNAYEHLSPHGTLIITIPNLHTFTSILSFVFRGCHSAFWGKNYPAHITALDRISLERMIQDLGPMEVEIGYSDKGRLPGLKLTWQRLFPFAHLVFKGQRFSDNMIFIAKRKN
ncbi:MAG: class I SAM-dependent methyltransferase [Bacteriovoracaceae bacterium]